MLNFNFRGYITPEQKTASTVEDIKTYLVDPFPATTRTNLFQNYIDFSNELKALLGGVNLEQWLNGSFVCNQVQNPSDIDIVIFISHETVAKFGKLLLDIKVKWADLGMDVYFLEVYPDSHSNKFYTKSDYANWYEQFNKTRRNSAGVKHNKGFLEINY